MFLKEDALEFTGQSKIEELVKRFLFDLRKFTKLMPCDRYSEFITFPIYLYREVEETAETSSSSDDEDDDEEDTEEDKPSDDLEVEEEEDEVELMIIVAKLTSL